VRPAQRHRIQNLARKLPRIELDGERNLARPDGSEKDTGDVQTPLHLAFVNKPSKC
jgi:hypothetical protein